MNNVENLYQEYLKIQKIIQSSYDIDSYDRDINVWLKDHYKQKYIYQTHKTYISIKVVREICQMWLDKIVFINKIDRFKKGWVDMIWFFLRGKYKERKRFLEMFYAIYYDMTSKLDALDGGTDSDRNFPSSKVGFGV